MKEREGLPAAFAYEDQALLVRRDAERHISVGAQMQGQDLHHSPLLDLHLDIVDGVRGFNPNREGLAGECLDEDLCTAAQQDYGMEPHTCTQHGAVYNSYTLYTGIFLRPYTGTATPYTGWAVSYLRAYSMATYGIWHTIYGKYGTALEH